MITNRHRGLVRIHGAAVILALAVFFWAYAEVTIRWLSDWMRLSREVNLLPYFLCLVAGLLVGHSRIRAAESHLARLTVNDAAGLATLQVALIALAIFSMMFATQDTRISRLFLGTFLVWSWLGLFWLHRALPQRLARLLYRQGDGIPTLFIGRESSLPRLQDWLDQQTHLGLRPVGFVPLGDAGSYGLDVGSHGLGGRSAETNAGPSATSDKTPDSFADAANGAAGSPLTRIFHAHEEILQRNIRPPSGRSDGVAVSPDEVGPTGRTFSTSGCEMSGLTAPLSELSTLLAERSIAQVILMELPEKPAVARQILAQCEAHGCRLLIHHQVDEILGHPVVTVDEGGRHFFALHDEPLEEPLNRALKRMFDVAVALPVVLLVLPELMLLVWLMQRLQAPGPLFHARPRSGERRVLFSMLKFRSMHVSLPDEKSEGRQASADDQRIYPFGRFLRRHSLDEFPQFWNVLLGDMSIVGPRPVMPLLDEEFERRVRAYRSKHWVRPGITGLAQSEGFRGEITTPAQLQERIRLDLYYIAHWSIWLDVSITLRTAWQILKPPPSAY